MIYYFTFGFAHNHPETGENLHDYWVEIEAPDFHCARRKMVELYGMKWAFQYTENEFERDYFRKGCFQKYDAILEVTNEHRD